MSWYDQDAITWRGIFGWLTGVPHWQENEPPWDPTAGSAWGSVMASGGGGVFLWVRYPCIPLVKCGLQVDLASRGQQALAKSTHQYLSSSKGNQFVIEAI